VVPEPAMDADRRFGGLARLYGVTGAAQVRDAHVAVIGIGGVGSWAVEALARSGVGKLTLIDLDHVAESNINRQLHALDSTVGQAKVVAMQQRIADINPACVVTCVEEFVEPGNWPQLLAGPVDALVDACDQMRAKVVLLASAVTITSRVPVSLMVPANTGSPGTLSTGMLSPVTGAWLTALVPTATVPSSGMRSPGLTRTMALTGTCAAATDFQLPSGWRTSAVSGVRSNRLLMALRARSTARPSINSAMA